MKDPFKYLLFFLLTSFLMFACVADDDPPTSGTELTIGDRIPPFSIILNNGKQYSDKDLLGSVSLIVFFNTACKDCQQEFPVLQQFYDSYPSYPLLCISRAESAQSISTYWKEHKLTLPYSAQEDRSLYEKFAKQTIPRIYIMDKEGIIRHLFTDNPLATLEDLITSVQQTESAQ